MTLKRTISRCYIVNLTFNTTPTNTTFKKIHSWCCCCCYGTHIKINKLTLNPNPISQLSTPLFCRLSPLPVDYTCIQVHWVFLYSLETTIIQKLEFKKRYFLVVDYFLGL